MEYRQGEPVTKPKRAVRRRLARVRSKQEQEANHQRAQSGGRENELGVTQGQNAEQGNTSDPRYSQPIGKTGA
jgi:hypothetical protein